MRPWFACSLVIVSWLALGAAAQAQAPISCPARMLAHPIKCERYLRTLELQAEEAAERDAARNANLAYRLEHPLRLGVVAQVDGFLLGFGRMNVASSWTFTSGVSLQRDIRTWLALRGDLLGRIGKGRIDSWRIDDSGEIHDRTGLFGGLELHGELLVRPNAFYVGPALSVGFLCFWPRTVTEQNYRGDDEESGGGPDTVRLRALSGYVAGGLALGTESTPDGEMAVGLRLLAGVWNDWRHPYLQMAVNVTIRVWD